MSDTGFNSLSTDELAVVADNFGVEFKIDERWGDKRKHQAILTAMLDEGVTWEFYEDTLNQLKAAEDDAEQERQSALPEPEVFDPASINDPTKPKREFKEKKVDVLVKMMRANPSFEVRGHKFTQEHPFAAMNEPDADFVVHNVEGFRYATTQELEEYYS